MGFLFRQGRRNTEPRGGVKPAPTAPANGGNGSDGSDGASAADYTNGANGVSAATTATDAPPPAPAPVPVASLSLPEAATTAAPEAPSFEKGNEMTVAVSAAQIDQAVEQTKPTLEALATELWQLAELSLQEVKSERLVMQALQEAGFTITSRGTSGVPTAFIAEWGSGGPKLGVLIEYDALPGLGNEAVPKREPRRDQTPSGHGCGHNLLGAAAVGAAIALKQIMQEHQIPGTLRVYGCAAEESEGAKVYMAREGLFDDLDAVLHWHPGADAGVSNVRSAATNSVRIEFFGKAAHAGGAPWQGRSALHAAELCAHGINLMREHVEPTARIHYVFERGGEAPNVVSDYARIRLYVRDVDRAHVEASTAWIKQIVEGAALATQTRGEALVYFGLYDVLPEPPAGRADAGSDRTHRRPQPIPTTSRRSRQNSSATSAWSRKGWRARSVRCPRTSQRLDSRPTWVT